jgi:NTE family protein
MPGKRIAIACQGGGSQCAFVAGALKTLFERNIQDRYNIVGLSGTSGGGLTAALAWIGLLERAQNPNASISNRILACWKDLSAQSPQEIVFDSVCIDLARAVERGWMPSVATSPASQGFQAWTRAASMMLGRPEFTDLSALLRKHIDFDAAYAMVRHESPVLLVGAGDVIDGTFKIFSSANRDLKAESLLASAAIPNLFPAVWVDGHAYWDGIFATNPPVYPFLRRHYMGKDHMPEEIWIIQVNRTHNEDVPETPSDITDRRNQLAGNLSLQHELQMIEMLNELVKEGALTDAFKTRFGIEELEGITVRFIRISEELQEHLDYPSKLSRQPRHIERLLDDGEKQTLDFLSKIGDIRGEPPPPPPEVPVVERIEPKTPSLI